ncbi:MAG: C45 family autoproteolytic acyltransferase/hydrolase [Pirellulaceae bacterium]|jgi:isopenicillin-N N-acyltransferase-like protein|nr:C45 family autoproteolytic acyltransferase/hydrolase [Pirellulaceae bacterium]MDP6720173.1 C45 family autoproteolytic acyltransferase/hydrolase [Pirellulaceae bacterium]
MNKLPSTTPLRYREISVGGSPRELGRQIGEAAREEVRGFCEVALARVNKTLRVSRERAMEIAAACIPLTEAYRSDLVDELRGTAEAAGVTLDDLMLLQVRNQLQPEHEAGCTSLSIAADASADGHAMVAQNWDNDPALDEFTIVLTRHPTDKPALMTVTQAGLISYLGISGSGIGACVNTLPAPARDIGVPHYFTLRELYEATSLEESVHAIRRADRAIPANIMLATPQGPADLEVTIDDVHVLRSGGNNYLTHTNHCVHADLLSHNDTFPELIESHPRIFRLDALLGEQSQPITIDDVQRMLADHDNHPRSICRHENDHPQNGFWTTVFSLVIQPTAGRMYVTRGTPCNHPFELYTLKQRA